MINIDIDSKRLLRNQSSIQITELMIQGFSSTMAKRDKVDEYALKYMMGHKINDITEATYTKRKPEWLMAEIMKIK